MKEKKVIMLCERIDNVLENGFAMLEFKARPCYQLSAACVNDPGTASFWASSSCGVDSLLSGRDTGLKSMFLLSHPVLEKGNNVGLIYSAEKSTRFQCEILTSCGKLLTFCFGWPLQHLSFVDV